jgi:acetylornithine deacetylase/succinyl-diaminopimelate desuccinylase-like protein
VNVDSALAYAQENRERFIEEYLELLRFPTVSTLPAHKPDMFRAMEWLEQRADAVGFDAHVYETAGHPVFYAELMQAGPDAPTVLVYAHYDVQPVEPLELWKTPPFEPTVIEDDENGMAYVHARGAADDKGQLYPHISAAEAMLAAGGPPVNIKLLFEGEEEIGSPSLAPFIAEHKDLLACDVIIVSDTGIPALDKPAICYGLRGIVGGEIVVKGPPEDKHSGIGNAVHNPINALVKMLGTMQDENGRVLVTGFYDDVYELTEEERAALAEQNTSTEEEWLENNNLRGSWGEPEYGVFERMSIRPSMDINGIIGGFTGEGGKTVLPAEARAKVTFRLVPDQDPADVIEKIDAFIESITPPTVEVSVTWGQSDGYPALTEIDTPPMQAAVAAYEAVYGAEPVFTRGGGSIPVVGHFQHLLERPVIMLGYGIGDHGHAPNERFMLESFHKGIELIVRCFANLAE